MLSQGGRSPDLSRENAIPGEEEGRRSVLEEDVVPAGRGGRRSEGTLLDPALESVDLN